MQFSFASLVTGTVKKNITFSFDKRVPLEQLLRGLKLIGKLYHVYEQILEQSIRALKISNKLHIQKKYMGLYYFRQMWKRLFYALHTDQNFAAGKTSVPGKTDFFFL